MSDKEQSQKFHDTISKLLATRLAKFGRQSDGSTSDLNLLACTEIYTTIFETLAEVVTESETKLDNEAVNYLAQQYYDGIVINGSQELDPNIFTRRATLEGIPKSELALLTVMLRGTDFVFPVIAEIKKRS